MNPKGWVAGDENGAVVISTGRLRDVIQRAVKILQVEKEMEQAARVGADLAARLAYDEVFLAKPRKALPPQLRSKEPSP